jgi:hypothetical protein
MDPNPHDGTAMPYTIERRPGYTTTYEYRAVGTRELTAGKVEKFTTCWQYLRKHAVRDARLVTQGAPTMGAKVEA